MGADTRQVSGEVAARFVLGLTAGCSDEDVKRAFRRLALIFHPDKNPGDDAEEAKRRFHAIVKAKECLLATLSKGGGEGGSGEGGSGEGGGGIGGGGEDLRPYVEVEKDGSADVTDFKGRIAANKKVGLKNCKTISGAPCYGHDIPNFE